MRSKLLFGSIATLLFLTPISRADAVLVGADGCSGSPLSCSYGYYVNPPKDAFDNSGQAAVQFSLSNASYVSTMDVRLGNTDFTGNATAMLSLVSSLTGSATTYASFTLGPLPYSYNSNEETVTLDQNLAAGTYYLVLAGLNTQESVSWDDSDGSYTQNAGTIAAGQWLSTDNGTTWDFYAANDPRCDPVGCNAAMFDVNGTPSSSPVPEPTSLVLLVPGVALAWRRKMWTRKSCRS
jgi:hypothetical protein